jgi:glucose/arabinose dehydrogenase
MRTILSTAILFLLPGVLAHGQAQREPEKRPEKQQQQAKPAQQAKQAQQARPGQQRAKSPPQQAKSAQPPLRHARIPDEKFRASFGSSHTFHVSPSDFSAASRRFQ